MVCSEFAVGRKSYTQELYTQENKEIFINIFTGFIPPILFMPPQYKKKNSGPEKISRKHIYTEDKNFLVPLELQLRETYLQLNSYKKLYGGAASNTDSMKIKTFMNIINCKRKVHNKTIWNKKSEVQ